MSQHTPKKAFEQAYKVDPSTLEEVTTVYREKVYIPKDRKADRMIRLYHKNGLPVLAFSRPSGGSAPYWRHERLHPANILTEHTGPLSGDYVQLLDAQGKPSENHAEVFMMTGELGTGLYLIEDMQSEAFAVVRLPEFDNKLRRAWQQVITATA